MNYTFLFLFLFVSHARCFYLPGISPVTYCTTDSSKNDCQWDVDVYVNKLDSVQSVLPYAYNKFPFCTSDKSYKPTENLGQILFGERIQNSPYRFSFGQKVVMEEVCSQSFKDNNVQLQFLKNGIKLNYKHHWIVDNLPVVSCYKSDNKEICLNGFSIGCYQNKNNKNVCIKDKEFIGKETFFLYNHVHLIITIYNEEETQNVKQGRIVFARAEVLSQVSTSSKKPLYITDKTKSISFYKSVTFEVTNTIKWSSRWDYLLKTMPQSNIQWFSILNSLVVVLFLSGMLAMVMIRTLHQDIDRYNKLDTEEAQEEFGWKLVHGDVFRPPRLGMTLCVFVGSGMQLIIMAMVTLFIACFGFLSPARRGSFATCGIVLYILSAAPAGYISARLYKMMAGEKWKSNVLLTAFLCPGSVFGLFFILNFVLWIRGSSAAVPFSTIIGILALWFLISVPLCFFGAYLGFKKKPISQPVRTNQIPRQVPYQSIYTRCLPSIFMGGILPFGCIFIQLFFILNSIWSTYIYFMFGLVFIVFVILLITSSETTVLLCYFHLCSEDYHWWWRSFLTSGCTAFYLFLYSIYFFYAKLDIHGSTSTFLYFGYTSIIIWLTFLLTGTVGFLASFAFVRKIYSVVKVD